jgi:hypothetical protein
VIAAGAITATEIKAGTITAEEVSAGSITATEIAAEAITAPQIAAGAVTATEIAAGSITSNEISAGTISADEIGAGQITGGKIASETTIKIGPQAGQIVIDGTNETAEIRSDAWGLSSDRVDIDVELVAGPFNRNVAHDRGVSGQNRFGGAVQADATVQARQFQQSDVDPPTYSQKPGPSASFLRHSEYFGWHKAEITYTLGRDFSSENVSFEVEVDDDSGIARHTVEETISGASGETQSESLAFGPERVVGSQARLIVTPDADDITIDSLAPQGKVVVLTWGYAASGQMQLIDAENGEILRLSPHDQSMTLQGGARLPNGTVTIGGQETYHPGNESTITFADRQESISSEWAFLSGLTISGDAKLKGDGAGALQVLASDGTNQGELVVETLTVTGTIDQKNTNELMVDDQYIEVASGQTGTPSLNAGLRAQRGDGAGAYLEWDEGKDRWGERLAGGAFKPYARLNASETVSGDWTYGGYIAAGRGSGYTTAPPQAATNTGWKIGLWGSRYWLGVGGSQLMYRSGNTHAFYAGADLPADDAGSGHSDSNAALSITRDHVYVADKLGIGTGDPSRALDVNGKSYFRETISAGDNNLTNVSTLNVSSISSNNGNNRIDWTQPVHFNDDQSNGESYVARFSSNGDYPAIQVDDAAQSGSYASGFTGSGWELTADGKMELGSISVRDTLLAREFETRKLRFSKGPLGIGVGGGKVAAIPAGPKEDGSGNYYWDLRFEADHGLSEGDLILTQEVDASASQAGHGEGVKSAASLRQVRAEVSGVQDSKNVRAYARNSAVGAVSEAAYNYADPQVGDDVFVIGNEDGNAARDSLILGDPYGPFIDVLDGTQSFADWESRGPETRLGNISGAPSLSDGTSPSGYGLYGRNVFLEGHLVADSGEINGSVLVEDTVATAQLAADSVKATQINVSDLSAVATETGRLSVSESAVFENPPGKAWSWAYGNGESEVDYGRTLQIVVKPSSNAIYIATQLGTATEGGHHTVKAHIRQGGASFVSGSTDPGPVFDQANGDSWNITNGGKTFVTSGNWGGGSDGGQAELDSFPKNLKIEFEIEFNYSGSSWAITAGSTVVADNTNGDLSDWDGTQSIYYRNRSTRIAGGQIITGTVKGDKLQANSVTADKASFDELAATAATVGGLDIENDRLYAGGLEVNAGKREISMAVSGSIGKRLVVSDFDINQAISQDKTSLLSNPNTHGHGYEFTPSEMPLTANRLKSMEEFRCHVQFEFDDAAADEGYILDAKGQYGGARVRVAPHSSGVDIETGFGFVEVPRESGTYDLKMWPDPSTYGQYKLTVETPGGSAVSETYADDRDSANATINDTGRIKKSDESVGGYSNAVHFVRIYPTSYSHSSFSPRTDLPQWTPAGGGWSRVPQPKLSNAEPAVAAKYGSPSYASYPFVTANGNFGNTGEDVETLFYAPAGSISAHHGTPTISGYSFEQTLDLKNGSNVETGTPMSFEMEGSAPFAAGDYYVEVRDGGGDKLASGLLNGGTGGFIDLAFRAPETAVIRLIHVVTGDHLNSPRPHSRPDLLDISLQSEVYRGALSYNGLAFNQPGGDRAIELNAADGEGLSLNGWSTFSDARGKSSVSALGSDALGMARAVPGRSFVRGGKDMLGVLAQDVEKVAPELVSERVASDSGETRKAVNYTGLHAIELSAIRTLDERQQALQSRVAELERILREEGITA